ncbi:MAG: hypothetical protein AAFU85_19590 [Planctomycetota bacterium]
MPRDKRTNPYQATRAVVGRDATPGNAFECKNCGCESFNRVKPEARFAFAKDYQCVECREQVPAPVPLWGALTMLFGGTGLVCVGGVLMIASAVDAALIPFFLSIAILVFGVKFASAGVGGLRG